MVEMQDRILDLRKPTGKGKSKSDDSIADISGVIPESGDILKSLDQALLRAEKVERVILARRIVRRGPCGC